MIKNTIKNSFILLFSLFSFSCTNNSIIENENIISLNKVESIIDYYPLKKGSNWQYSLEQFQDDKPNTKFREMIISIEDSNDNYSIIKRFYPNSTIQPNMTKALISDEKIELSRYDLLENNMNIFGINSIDILKAPLKKGNYWEGRIFNGGTETIIVEGKEKLKVIAGTFETIKINHKIKYNNGREDNLYYWYAKNIGTIKMYEEVSLQTSSNKWIKMKSIGVLEKFLIN